MTTWTTVFETVERALEVDGPVVEFQVPLPFDGERVVYRLAALRSLCTSHGHTAFDVVGARDTVQALSVRIQRDTPALPPIVALNMIARDTAKGLERAIQSILPAMDEIVIGVDGRSTDATLLVAEAYADTFATFTAADLEMSEEDFQANRMHFANARNHTRKLVQAPWVLVIDTDELAFARCDLRALLQQQPASCMFVRTARTTHGTDTQYDMWRLTAAVLRYTSAMHNRLVFANAAWDQQVIPSLERDAFLIVDDSTYKPAEFEILRESQREHGILELERDGLRGDLSALYHAAKHYLSATRDDLEHGIQLAEQFRLVVEPHDSAHKFQRVHLALCISVCLLQRDDIARAEMWAVRALLDGPSIEAFTLLGLMARDREDRQLALQWFEAACAITPDPQNTYSMVELGQLRLPTRDALRSELQSGVVRQAIS